jgi:dynein heavy chain
LSDSKRPLRKLRRKQDQALDLYSQAIQSELTMLQRLKLKAIIVIEIHARDVIDRLYRIGK